MLLSLLLMSAFAQAKDWSEDNTVRDFLIKESIRRFSGDCPCPFHRRANGKECGTRSGYDLSNGREPYCYRTDITVEMVQEFRGKVKRGEVKLGK